MPHPQAQLGQKRLRHGRARVEVHRIQDHTGALCENVAHDSQKTFKTSALRIRVDVASVGVDRVIDGDLGGNLRSMSSKGLVLSNHHRNDGACPCCRSVTPRRLNEPSAHAAALAILVQSESRASGTRVRELHPHLK